jgi:ABC-type uncharacterized transport system substrate-binding protein
MRRRAFITLVGGATAWPVAARAQIATRRPLVAILHGQSSATATRDLAAFAQRIQELGYVEARAVNIVYRYLDGDVTRLPVLVDELVQLNPDIVVTSNTQSAIAVRQATARIPIVAVNVTDPVAFGLVASQARPGGNVTGILSNLDTLPGKQIELGAEVVRNAVKMGLLLNAGFLPHAIHRQGAEAAAAALAIKLVPIEIRLPNDLDATFQSFVRERVDSVLVLQDPMFLTERHRIAMLALAARLPTMFGYREHVEAGGLMSYGIDLRANYRRAADYVDKILQGSKPGDLPVELPTRYELVLNVKTARALGLDIPPTLLARADEVIE